MGYHKDSRNGKPTETELSIIKLLYLPNKVIGQRIGITGNGVTIRIQRLMDRVGVENRTALVIKALKENWIGIEDL
jgi:DNA-binding NarL/FixJ family response regulator